MSNSIINKIYTNTTTQEAVTTAVCNGKIYINWTCQGYAMDVQHKYVLSVVFEDGSRTLTTEVIYPSATSRETITSEITLHPEYMPSTSMINTTIYITDYDYHGNPWRRLSTGPAVRLTLIIPSGSGYETYYPSLINGSAGQWSGCVRGAEQDETYYYLTGDAKFTANVEYTPGDGALEDCIMYLISDSETIQDGQIYSNPAHYEKIFNNSGTYSIALFGVDSRKRITSVVPGGSPSITVWAYQKPSVKIDIVRDTSSSTAAIKCSYTSSRSSLGLLDTGNLMCAIHIDRKDLTIDGDWQNDWYIANIQNNDNGILTIAMSCNDDNTDNEYAYSSHEWAFRAWVDDTVMNAKYPTQSTRRSNSLLSSTVQIQGEGRIINIHRDGNGIAFGKVAKMGNTFECDWDSQMNANVYFGGGNDKTIVLPNMCYPLCMDDDTWGITSGQTNIRRSSQTKFGSCSVRFDGTTSTSTVEWIPQLTASGRIKPKVDNTHVYYVCLWIYQTTKQGSTSVYWPSPTHKILSNGTVSAVNTWTKISNVFNCSGCTNGGAIMHIEYNNANQANYLYADGLTLYDLTAAFGSGNEPNKAWCDANLDYEYQTKSIIPTYNFTCDIPSTFGDSVNVNADAIINGNVTGHYLQGTWLQTTSAYDLDDETSRFCVLDNKGWVYTKPVVDFVVEEGTSGIWNYRKWNSGLAECWGRYELSGVQCNSDVGSWFKTDYIYLPQYPFTFAEDPEINMFFDTHTGTGGLVWSSGYDSLVQTTPKVKPNAIYIIRMTSSNSVSGCVNAKVIGRWK